MKKWFLKPCPFCGADLAEIIKCGSLGSAEVYAGWCPECGARSGRCGTKAEAADAWNTRESEDNT